VWQGRRQAPVRRASRGRLTGVGRPPQRGSRTDGDELGGHLAGGAVAVVERLEAPHGLGRQLSGLPPAVAAAGLVAAYYLSHYLFATTTAHATAIFPVMLGVGLAIPGLAIGPFAMLLAVSHGLMGVLSPYATGPAPVYNGSGYLPSATFWRLGAAFGAVFLAALLLLGLPAAAALWR
jgi:hypothetical protein